MASGRAFIDSIAEQLDLGARLARREMFGVYALSLGRKVVAFACDDSLFIKPNDAVARLHPELPQRPPYPGAKDCPMADELLDDADALRRVFIDSAAVLPEAKPKKTKRTSARQAVKQPAAGKREPDA